MGILAYLVKTEGLELEEGAEAHSLLVVQAEHAALGLTAPRGAVVGAVDRAGFKVL